MNIILFDDNKTTALQPFTLTRPAASLRCGISTLAEKWERLSGKPVSFLCAPYLALRYPSLETSDNFYINGRYFANPALFAEIAALSHGKALHLDGDILAYRGASFTDADAAASTEYTATASNLNRIHDLFTNNKAQIFYDIEQICSGRKGAELSKTNTVFGNHPVFLEEGAKAEAAVFNTSEGPVYIGKNAEVMEGALIRGPFALGESSTIKMGAKMYGDSSVGPHCKVGGEVSNSLIFGYSNKGHDGFLGNSVLGEWCNLGADTNNSNLKNNYEEVKLWNYASERFEKTGLQFCGLFMGDHSKCGINTMFNTGTVVGVSSNIFGSGFPRNFVPSFSWGGSQGFETYAPSKAYDTARRVMERRHVEFTDADKHILDHIYNIESKYRNWEKS